MRVMQVNIHPNDIGYVPHILRHQIRVWSNQVDRIHVTVDTHGSAAGHYRSENLDTNLSKLEAVLAKIQSEEPKVVVDIVDPSPEMRHKVAMALFGRQDVPLKAWHGGPFYSYLYGLYKAEADYVVHFDGDMLFGGRSSTWLDEAVAMLEERPNCLYAGPLPGPPNRDGSLLGHGEHWKGVSLNRLAMDYPAYSFNHVSTRIFVTSMSKLLGRFGGHLPWHSPDLRRRVHATLLGNPPQTMNLERGLTMDMKRGGYERVDFLGTGPGMWSLHPPYRTADFYNKLPEIVQRVEENGMPEAQLGHYDVVDELVDWSEVRSRSNRPARWKRHAQRILDRLKSA